MKYILNKVPTVVMSALRLLKVFCLKHPTCEGCPFRYEYKGCMFRGLTPREYDVSIDED